MLDRAVEPQDTNKYDYDGGNLNINQYGDFALWIEDIWMLINNWSDYLGRGSLLMILMLMNI